MRRTLSTLPPEDTKVRQRVRPDDIPDPVDNRADTAPPNADPNQFQDSTEDQIENIQLPLPDPHDNQPPLITDDTPSPPQQEPPPPPPDKTWNFEKVSAGEDEKRCSSFQSQMVRWNNHLGTRYLF